MVRELGWFAPKFGLITAPAFVPKIAHESDFQKSSASLWALTFGPVF